MSLVFVEQLLCLPVHLQHHDGQERPPFHAATDAPLCAETPALHRKNSTMFNALQHPKLSSRKASKQPHVTKSTSTRLKKKQPAKRQGKAARNLGEID